MQNHKHKPASAGRFGPARRARAFVQWVIFPLLLILAGIERSVAAPAGNLDLQLDLIINTGDEVAGGDANFASFNLVVLDSDSQVLFRAFTTGNQDLSGLHAANFPGLTDPVLIGGATAPGVIANGQQGVFDLVPNGQFAINRNDFFAYNATTETVATNRSTVFSQIGVESTADLLTNFEGLDFGPDNGAITVPDIATGADRGGFFGGTIFDLGVTEDNRVVLVTDFGGGVPGGGSGQITPLTRGVFVGTGLTDWTNVVSQGDQAPGFAPGVTLNVGDFLVPRNSEDIIIPTGLSDGRTVYWRFADNALTAIASDDEPAPGFAGRDWEIDDIVVGYSDQVLLAGRAVATGQADIQSYWLESANGDLDVVIEAAADGSISTTTSVGAVDFETLSTPLLGPDNTILFFAGGRQADGSFVSGLWQRTIAGDVTLLAATDSEAPGQSISIGNNVGALLFRDFTLREVNENGQVLISATLGRSSFTASSLWLIDAEGGFNFIAKEGDQIDGVVVDEFLFDQFGADEEDTFALNDVGAVAFLARIPDGSDAGSSRDYAVFRALFTAAELQELLEYIFSGACGSSNWHDPCGDSNWNDQDDNPAMQSPGDANGTENVRIDNQAVVIADRAVNIRSIDATGSLAVNQNLTIQADSAIENIELAANLTANGPVGLSGAQNIWRSGEIGGDSGVSVLSGAVLTIDPVTDPVTLSTGLNVDGRAVQTGDVQLAQGTTQPGGISTGAAGTYEIASGSITDSTGQEGGFNNAGTLLKSGTGPSTVATHVNNQSTGIIEVSGGTLTLNGGGTLLGGTLEAGANSTLVLADNPTTQPAEVFSVTGDLTATGQGTLRLEQGVGLDIGDGATLNIGLTAAGGDGLEVRGATVTGGGTLLISDTGRTLAHAARFDELGGGLTNQGVLLIDNDTSAASGLTLNQTLLLNDGLVIQTAGVEFAPPDGQEIGIHNRATYTLDGAVNVSRMQNSAVARFENALGGRIIKEGAGAASISTDLVNRGLVEVAEGTLRLTGSTEFRSSTIGDGLSVDFTHSPNLRGELSIGIQNAPQTHRLFGNVIVDGVPNSHFIVNDGLELQPGASLDTNFVTVDWFGGDIEGTERANRNSFIVNGELNISDPLNTGELNLRNVDVRGTLGSIEVNQSGDLRLTNASIAGIEIFEIALDNVDIFAGDDTSRLENISFLVRTRGEHIIEPVFRDNSLAVLEGATVRVLNPDPTVLTGNTLLSGRWTVDTDASIFVGSSADTPEIRGIGPEALLEIRGDGDREAGQINNLPNVDGDFTNAGELAIKNSRFSAQGTFFNFGNLVLANGQLTTEIDFQSATGSTIIGNGSIRGRVVVDGVIAPGKSPGALLVDGNYQQGATGVLEIELAGTEAGTYDQLIVNGEASFAAGAVIDVTVIDPNPDDEIDEVFLPSTGDVFDFLVAEDVIVEGDLADLITFTGLPNGLRFEPDLVSLNGQLQLQVAAFFGSDLTSIPLLSNSEQQLAGVIDATSITTDDQDFIDFALAVDGIEDTQRQLDTLNAASLSFASALFDFASVITETHRRGVANMLWSHHAPRADVASAGWDNAQRAGQGYTPESRSDWMGVAQQLSNGRVQGELAPGVTGLVQLSYQTGSFDESANQDELDYDGAALDLGLIRETGNFGFGGMLHVGDYTGDISGSDGDIDAQSVGVSAFARWRVGGKSEIFATVAGGRYEIDYDRTFVAPGVTFRASGDGDADYVFADLGYRTRLNWGVVAVDPIISVDYLRVETDDIRESGAGSRGLFIEDDSYEQISARIGWELGLGQRKNSSTRIGFFYRNQLDQNTPELTASFLDPSSTNFAIPIDAINEDGFELVLGYTWQQSDRVRIALDYQGLLNDGSRVQHSVGGTMLYRF